MLTDPTTTAIPVHPGASYAPQSYFGPIPSQAKETPTGLSLSGSSVTSSCQLWPHQHSNE